jgi:hypothetical protein
VKIEITHAAAMKYQKQYNQIVAKLKKSKSKQKDTPLPKFKWFIQQCEKIDSSDSWAGLVPKQVIQKRLANSSSYLLAVCKIRLQSDLFDIHPAELVEAVK